MLHFELLICICRSGVFSFSMKVWLQSHLSISDSLCEHFISHAQRKRVPKGHLLFQTGIPNQQMLFIERGLLRAYRLIEGKEYTHHFFVENWFATDYQSYLTGQKSLLYIESLTETTYFEFSKKTLLSFYDAEHAFEKLGRIIAEHAYLRMVERLVNLQTQSLKERYLNLINTSPSLFQQVPQKYIASYLGVAEQSLSRIKAGL